ncbi:MAG: UDP-glucose 4-epimerase GalE [Betaproteobacteria bacterium]|nr:UDP-glucose 4-epimerase GalE [Betaproteobacteria bacterium]
MILVTGGLGYIGSHTCVALQRAGYPLAVVDNLANSKVSVLERIRDLGGGTVEFHRVDLRDETALAQILKQHPVEAVIHFAGHKAVGESISKPLEYYDNNIGGTLTLLKAMERHGVRRIVFSSSATVYGDPQRLPLDERHPLGAVNPYGRTKQFIESILTDMAAGSPVFRHATLRYFNPIGAHPSGHLGEDPRGTPNNLFPYVTQVAVGRLDKLKVLGNDYDTVDGTGVRDYIHVMDLADGHVAALRYLMDKDRSITANLGTGRGYSVLEVVSAFERVTGIRIPYEIAARRPGDVASCYADPALALREMAWKTHRGIEDMCRDGWAWQSANPQGYPD